MMELSCKSLRCNGMERPLGVDDRHPKFSWRLWDGKRGSMQIKYRLTVAYTQRDLEEGQKLLWDTGEVASESCLYIPYEGEPLRSATVYFWRVEAFDNHGNRGASSSFFETAFLHRQDWEALWIEPEQEAAYEEPFIKYKSFIGIKADLASVIMRPAQLVRRGFTLEGAVKRARAYMTSHGIYFFEINGKRVGDLKLAPEFTAYDKYLQYQVYDVTGFLAQSGNAIGMVIGDGWYTGKVGMPGRSCQYGDRLAALFQIEVEFADGAKARVCSDGECRSATGPIQYADLFVGEKYDATKERTGFSTFGYNDTGWSRVKVLPDGYETLVAQPARPVRVLERRKLEKIWVSPRGETILDAGQVLTGYLRMRVKAPEGTEITLEYTETIDKERNYLNNAQGRFTIQTDTYIAKGAEEEIFEPEFTFHGFRYVRLTGYRGTPTPDDFEVLVVGSDLEKTGGFSCSDERLNRLQRNIVWSQKGNMVSIPMDCPQREKQGWTGDAQIFAPTACYNMDMYLFFKRWLANMRLEQEPDGQIPNVIPYIKAYRPGQISVLDTHASAGWGDACVIIPWVLYNVYGDEEILRENYGMMQRWLAYIRNTAETGLPEGFDPAPDPERAERMKYLWNTGFHFAEWLTPSLSLDPVSGKINMAASAFKTKHIVPTCFYAYTAELLAKIAAVLGCEADAAGYGKLYDRIRAAFIAEFVNEDGSLETELQGVYVLALQMNLIPARVRRKTSERLSRLIRENGNRLDTGFLSVPFLLEVLMKEGEGELAFDVLFQDECPSWLYEVKMGATTIWELWQAILPDGTVTESSFNHYAFGCVGDWMYRAIGGIRAKAPGYKEIEIRPVIDKRLPSAEAGFGSVFGPIRCSWELKGGRMSLRALIPPNTTATIVLPGAVLADVLESGEAWSQAEGICDAGQQASGAYLRTGSGRYHFQYDYRTKQSMRS